MNIEFDANPDLSGRVIRRLVSPIAEENAISVPKTPGPNSKSITIGKFHFGIKAYLTGKKAFSYRCSNRSICSGLIHVPLEQNYDENLELINSKTHIVSEISSHSDKCLEKKRKEAEDQNNPVEIQTYACDVKVLESYVKKFPLAEPKSVKAEMLKINQKFTNGQILSIIQQVRNEMFPRDRDKVFSSVFCAALDSSENTYNLFKCHVKLPFFGKKLLKLQFFKSL